MKLTVSSLALALLVGAPALADVVHMADGRRLEGAVSVEGGRVVVRQRWGEVRVERAEVDRIEETDDPWDQLSRLQKELGQGTAEERYRLGEWARTQGFKAESQQAFLDVLRVDPDHPGARAALGYVLHEGRWVTAADRNRALGLVEHQGQWVTPDEKAKRLAEGREARAKERQAREDARAEREQAKAAEKARKDQEREDERQARLERRRAAELELAKARARLQAEEEAWARSPTRFYYGPGGVLYPVGYPCGGYRVLGGGGIYYGGCYPYPVQYGSYSGYGYYYNSGLSGFYNGGNWGIRFRVGF